VYTDWTLDYYNKKYLTFPTGWKAKDGTPYIITLPRTYFGEFTSTLENWVIDQIADGEFRPKELFNAAGELVPYTPEGTQPVVQLAWAYFEWLTGKNPEDMYRDRSIIPRDVFGKGLLAETPDMIGWTAEKMLGNDITKTAEGVYEYATGENDFDKPLLDNVLEFPGLGRLLGQFIRRADGQKK